jgi:transposase
MSAERLYQMMGLIGYHVEDVWLNKTDELFVFVSVARDALCCRNCGCRRVHLDDGRRRLWKGVPLGLTPVFVAMQVPRVKCLQCGSKTWHQPRFANGQRQVTRKFEEYIESWLPNLTIRAAAERFGVSWNTIRDIDMVRLKKLPRPQLKRLQRLAIDENYLGKRHKYITIVVDLDTRAIVSVTKGRGQAALKGFFSRLKKSGAKIRAVATDMAGGYIAAVRKHLPDAKLVFDRFHVVKLMNEKLTILRRDLYRELTDGLQRDALKGIRWLLLKNRENLVKNDTIDEQQTLDEALKLNDSLFKAYYLKDELQLFWKQSSKTAAKKFLEQWCRRAHATGIRVLQTMSKTLLAHKTGLLTWYDEPISTGPLEGINNKIGALQRRAYGYRNYEHLVQRLLTLHHTQFVLKG